MRIIVCIKQVPGTAKVNIDEETGNLMRSGVESKMNPYDLYAIEAALQLKHIYERNESGGDVMDNSGFDANSQSRHSICVLTMGPPQAEEIIREAFMLGADEGFLLSDRRFAGADVLATSYALAAAIKKIGDYDLIICGKQTTDGDTAQTGPALAEWLDIPHVSWVSHIISADEKQITMEQDLADFTQIVTAYHKSLITVEKDICPLRLPSYRMKLKTAGRKINKLSLEDLDGAVESLCGLKGSATRVEKIFPPEINTQHVIYEGDSEDVSLKMFSILSEVII